MRASGLEVWAGGCLDDVERTALLGVRRVWCPLHLSSIAPDGIATADWSAADRQLVQLRDHGIDPILTFVQHQAGAHAAYAGDAEFPGRLARFAGAVARRYPWLRHFAPVEAPSSIAAEQRTGAAVVGALLNLLDGVSQAMQAVRTVIPDAKLVQTENVATFFGTGELASQVEFENALRWSALDLQTGNFAKNLSVRKFFRYAGAYLTNEDLGRYYGPPDIIALSYGLSSERFLDHRVENYERQYLQQRETLSYANVPVARVCIEGIAGVRAPALECSARYNIPIAVKHEWFPCTGEEQLRWWNSTYKSVLEARSHGAEIQALSISTLFGSPGAYDRRSDPPRPTALASAIWAIAHQRDFDHPVLDATGWARAIGRFAFPPVFREAQIVARPPAPTVLTRRAVVLAGADEPLGLAIRTECVRRNIPVVPLPPEFAASDSLNELTSFLLERRAWAVVDCSGTEYLSHAWSETENVVAPAPRYRAGLLPDACERLRARLLCFSGSEVFSGAAGRPYLESDDPDAIDRFGRSRARRESDLLGRCERTLIVRSGVVFSPPQTAPGPAARPRLDGLASMLQRLAEGCEVRVQSAVVFSAAYAGDVAAAALDLLIDGEDGTLHLANGGTTWPALLGAAASRMGFERPGAVRERSSSLGRTVLLGSERGRYLGSLDQALDDYAGRVSAAQRVR